mgnify:CR=1 FL=1
MANIAVLGYGTVGSGVVEVLNTNKDRINSKSYEPINIKYVLDLRDFPGDHVQEIITHDYNDILNDNTIDVVVEVMGGINPAYTFVKQALESGKSVCTSNKELVAAHGGELMALAKEYNVNFLYEASVGGGIPIIRPINRSITSDEIVKIVGILNGTTNYMLTKMSEEGLEYNDVLSDAQAKGYAERNPEADIEGYDAVRKIAILASLAKGKTVNFEEIYTEGISKITAEDFKYAKAMGRSIKLLGKCKNEDNQVVASVAPRLLAPDHPLFNVSGVVNGILVRGNMVGDLVFIGSGAGKLPTASAVVSDVVDSVRHLNVSTTVMWDEEKLELEDFSKSKKKFFVRSSSSKEDIEKVFGNVEYVDANIDGEFGFITEKISEATFAKKADELGTVISRIRIEG